MLNKNGMILIRYILFLFEKMEKIKPLVLSILKILYAQTPSIRFVLK